MSSDMDALIQMGNDILSAKYYALAAGSILFYDYLLTLADEVEYIWSAKKPWTFWLFIVNRYFPMIYQLWQIIVNYVPRIGPSLCEKTSWFCVVTFAFCTFFAQVMLTVRIYAVTLKNIPIAIAFGTITVSQLTVGLWATVLAAKGGVQQSPQVPLDAFQACVHIQHKTLEITYTALSLGFDFLAFSLIVFLAVTSKTPGLRIRSILDTIVEDAMHYFLIIFTSHFVVEMTLVLGRETIQFLPAPGNVVYLPVMISRIMLSLRKAADPLRGDWSLWDTSSGIHLRGVEFALPEGGAHGREDDV